jgi:hypothetical protein
MIKLILSSRPVDQQPSELIAVGLFQDGRPLRSEAGFLDRSMGGMISARLSAGFMTGQLGERTLIPTNGRVRAEKMLFLGLGERAAFSYGRIREFIEHVVAASRGLQVQDVALALPDTDGLGLEWAKLTEAVMEGIVRGAKGSERLQDICLRILGGGDQFEQVLEGVKTAREILRNPFEVEVVRDPYPEDETQEP